MRELSVAEQRYQAVLAVISDGETVTDVAARFGVSRKTVQSAEDQHHGAMPRHAQKQDFARLRRTLGRHQ